MGIEVEVVGNTQSDLGARHPAAAVDVALEGWMINVLLGVVDLNWRLRILLLYIHNSVNAGYCKTNPILMQIYIGGLFPVQFQRT